MAALDDPDLIDISGDLDAIYRRQLGEDRGVGIEGLQYFTDDYKLYRSQGLDKQQALNAIEASVGASQEATEYQQSIAEKPAVGTVDYGEMFPGLDFSGIELTGDPEQDIKLVTAKAIEQSIDLASRPYEEYPSERVVGYTPEELAAREQLRTLATSGMGYPQAEQAAMVAGRVAGYQPPLLRDVDLEPYQSQYQTGVTDVALRELDRQRQLRQQDIAQQALASSAFGGSRQGVVEAELDRTFAQQAGDIATRGAQAGLEYAQRGALQDLAAQRAAPQTQLAGASALSQAANQLRSIGYSDAEIVQRLGESARGLEQARADVDYGMFQEAQAFPSQQLSYLMAPFGGGSASGQPQIDQPSFLQSTLGILGGVGNLYGSLTGNPLIGGQGSLFGAPGSYLG